MTYEENLLAFGAAKQYVRDLEYQRAAAFTRGQAWTEERQTALDEAKATRSELAREIMETKREAASA